MKRAAIIVLVGCSSAPPAAGGAPSEAGPRRSDAVVSDATSAPDSCGVVGDREKVVFAPARAQALEQAQNAGMKVSADGVVESSGGPVMRAWPIEAAGASCRDDTWPDDVRHCLVAASSLDAWSACLERLPRPLQLRHDHRESGRPP